MSKSIIINGEETHFRITPNGIVFSRIKRRKYRFRVHTGGYLQISLAYKGGFYHFFGHRLVAIYFIDNPENKPCVNHLNGNKQDNRKVNLAWATDSENQCHSYENGLNSRNGKNNGKSKLTEGQVLEIRMNKHGSRVAMSKKYNVAESTIRNVIYNRSWTHI